MTSSAKRVYTGTKDGVGNGEAAGLTVLIKELIRRSEGSLWNNGSFGVRNMRGKESLSVHATGRAVDLSYRKMPTKGIVNGRKKALVAIDWLILNADALGLEMVIDYQVAPFGRAWRCDRMAWLIYDKETVHGTPTGDWFHLEVSPLIGRSAEKMRAAIQHLNGETV